jgi:hypothetical protein
VTDADKLTGWLAGNVCVAERRPDLVRDELMVRSTLHQAEQTLTARIVARLPADVAGRLRGLVAVDAPDDDTCEESVLALIKSVPGNVSLESMLTEIRKLRAVGLPAGLFAEVVPVPPARPFRAADADPARGAAAHPTPRRSPTPWRSC